MLLDILLLRTHISEKTEYQDRRSKKQNYKLLRYVLYLTLLKQKFIRNKHCAKMMFFIKDFFRKCVYSLCAIQKDLTENKLKKLLVSSQSMIMKDFKLTHVSPMLQSYRNQPPDLPLKPNDCFLYVGKFGLNAVTRHFPFNIIFNICQASNTETFI